MNSRKITPEPRFRRTVMAQILYTPDSALKRPRELISSMLSDFINSWGLAWRLFVRDISARYRQSLLGYIWALVPPLATTFIFVFLNHQGVLKVNDTSIPYPLFVLTGTILWQLFADSLQSPIRVVRSYKALLTKTYFPREALILSGLFQVSLDAVIRFVALALVLLWYNVNLSPTFPLGFLGIIAITAFGLFLGVFLVPLSALFSDFEHGLSIILTALFFITPVIYPLPHEWKESGLMYLNPMAVLLPTTRDLLLLQGASLTSGFLLITAVVFVLVFFSWLLFRLAMPHLVERFGS